MDNPTCQNHTLPPLSEEQFSRVIYDSNQQTSHTASLPQLPRKSQPQKRTIPLRTDGPVARAQAEAIRNGRWRSMVTTLSRAFGGWSRHSATPARSKQHLLSHALFCATCQPGSNTQRLLCSASPHAVHGSPAGLVTLPRQSSRLHCQTQPHVHPPHLMRKQLHVAHLTVQDDF